MRGFFIFLTFNGLSKKYQSFHFLFKFTQKIVGPVQTKIETKETVIGEQKFSETTRTSPFSSLYDDDPRTTDQIAVNQLQI